jgi:hypothetical protein
MFYMGQRISLVFAEGHTPVYGIKPLQSGSIKKCPVGEDKPEAGQIHSEDRRGKSVLSA